MSAIGGNPLVGTWRLVDIINRDADGNLLRASYGPKKMGVYVFNDDNRCMVVISDGREHVPEAEMPREYTSYSGTYQFDGEALYVDVDCSTATEPPRVGTRQKRPARFEGPDRVVLAAPPIPIDGVVNHRDLIWERIA